MPLQRGAQVGYTFIFLTFTFTFTSIPNMHLLAATKSRERIYNLIAG
jgi:hypothetical protein